MFAAGAFGPPSIGAGASRTFPILSSTTCTIPATARAYSLDIAVVPPGPLAYVTVYPTGEPSPVAAVAVESPQGSLASSTGIIPAGTNGSVDVYANNPTDVVIDINGYYAPYSSLIGGLSLDNTLLGVNALGSNTSGHDNTANGWSALLSNTTGEFNTSSGAFALEDNTTGSGNTASGYVALQNNTTGGANTATGYAALENNTTGQNNTAIGYDALQTNTTGSLNIAIGWQAGANVSGGGANIHIGNPGTSSDTGAIRIGSAAMQHLFFAAGIRGITTSNNDAIPVLIDSAGQLGTVSSSRRFKEDIHDMGDTSSSLMRLRPVTFRYQKPFADGSKPIQFGLIAEEVADVYPDLVARSADGQIETVKYQVLDSMLLNELQKEHRQVQQQAEKIRLLESRLAALEESVLFGK
jgi:hypothetical protein